MLTLRRCCLPGGVGKSEGVGNTTIHFTESGWQKKTRKKRSVDYKLNGRVLVQYGQFGQVIWVVGHVGVADKFRCLVYW